MPNIILPNSIFMHIMKTGGQWTWRTLRDCGLGSDAGMPHTDLRQLSLSPYYRPGTFRFAFVRHPLEWYRSWYKHSLSRRAHQRLPRNWDNRFCYERLSHPHVGVSFEEFCEYVLEFHPAYCTNNYWACVGAPEDEIEFIGRTENLRCDLIKALNLAGESVSEDQYHAILLSPRHNVSCEAVADYTPSLLEEFRRNEAPSLERFGYE